MENCSIRSEYSDKIANIALEFREYKGKSGGTQTRSGHFLRAMAIGSPVIMPNFFAGVDFARTMPCLLSLSPPTIEGISLRSVSSPFFKRSAAVQLRNALLTSI